MHIVKDNVYIKEDIFDGRNTEWFRNMMQQGGSDEYDYLPIRYGLSPKAPKSLNQEKLAKDGYFGFYHIQVKAFLDWFCKYRPDMDAGWVTTYDKWRAENKGYTPELMYTLPEDARIEDMHFITITNSYDCSTWLYQYLKKNRINKNADITYWFDH